MCARPDASAQCRMPKATLRGLADRAPARMSPATRLRACAPLLLRNLRLLREVARTLSALSAPLFSRVPPSRGPPPQAAAGFGDADSFETQSWPSLRSLKWCAAAAAPHGRACTREQAGEAAASQASLHTAPRTCRSVTASDTCNAMPVRELAFCLLVSASDFRASASWVLFH